MEQFTFYELYASLLQGMDEVSAGKFARRICAYEFEDKEPDRDMSPKESFYWSNISDILTEVKAIEKDGKVPKKYNFKAKHFTFYDTYYKAMQLLNDRQCGAFVRAICAYMFDGTLPEFKDKSLQSYFDLCKRRMDISKKRKSVGKVGGTARKTRTKVVVEQNEQPVRPTTFKEFMAKHSELEGYLSDADHVRAAGIDWDDLDAKLSADADLAREKNIHYLIRNYILKYPKKQ